MVWLASGVVTVYPRLSSTHRLPHRDILTGAVGQRREAKARADDDVEIRLAPRCFEALIAEG